MNNGLGVCQFINSNMWDLFQQAQLYQGLAQFVCRVIVPYIFTNLPYSRSPAVWSLLQLWPASWSQKLLWFHASERASSDSVIGDLIQEIKQNKTFYIYSRNLYCVIEKQQKKHIEIICVGLYLLVLCYVLGKHLVGHLESWGLIHKKIQ